MTRKADTLPLFIFGTVVLLIGATFYWFIVGGGATDDAPSFERRSEDVIPKPTRTENEDVVARRFVDDSEKRVPVRGEQAVRSETPSPEKMFLSCRLEGVKPEDVGSYRLQPGPIDTPRGIHWAPPALSSMPADGSPLELDVTGMRELIERTRGFFLAVSHVSGAEHRATYDLGALTRREEAGRIVYDVVVPLDGVTIVMGRIVSGESDTLDRHLYVYPFEGDRPKREPVRTSSPALDGRFEFLLDLEQEWLIVCVAAGYAPLSLHVPRHADAVFDFGKVELSRGETISGIVTRQGVPQPGARVRAVLEDFVRADDDRIELGGGDATWRNGRVLWSDLTTTTGADGSYRMTRLDRLRYEVTVESVDGEKVDVHESLRAALGREVVASTGGVDFEVGGVKLNIRVRDETGPLEEWLMSVTAPEEKSWFAIPSADSDINTVYVPADTPLEVVVSHLNYETFRGKISFQQSETSANYEVVMKAIVVSRLRVRVRDHEALRLRRLIAFAGGSASADDVPVYHRMIRANRHRPPPNMFMAEIDDDGSFTFDDLTLTKGSHEIMFLSDGVGSVPDLIPVTMNVDLDPERLNTIEIIFRQGGHARFRARDGNGTYVEGKATIRDPAGNEFSADLNPTEPTPGALAVAGPLSIGTDRLSRSGPSTTRVPMLPGRYQFEVVRPDGTRKSVPFEIKSGQFTDVVVDF